MQRDWELVRKILSELESLGSTAAHLDSFAIKGYAPDIVSYHYSILKQAGLIEATCTKTYGVGLECFATGITWEGHEFLDKIRSDTVWKKIKKVAKTKGVNLSIDVIGQIAIEVITELLS